MSGEGTVADTLIDRPDLEGPLEAILTVDEAHETWSYDDVPVGSGPFGELVSRGVVETVGDEYRLANPDAVSRALQADEAPQSGDETVARQLDSGRGILTVNVRIDRVTFGLVSAILAVFALTRIYVLPEIYRGSRIVLSSNDPYYYRYWLERAAAESSGFLDFGALSALPRAVQNGEPLMVSTLWWVAELLGGSIATIGHVLAWYPVVSALTTAGLVYLITVTLTADRRVGLAAVLVLAIVPGHALRTSLGFADHHAFDFPWLVATALLLVGLVGADRADLGRPRTWLTSGLLGVAVAGQVLAWEAGPLLIAPVGLAVLATTLLAVDADRSPVSAGLPIAVGLAVASILAGAVHVFVGWHTAEVAFSPGLMLVGTLVLIAIAEIVARTTGDVRHLVGGELVAGIAGVLGFVVLFPNSWNALLAQLDRLIRSDAIAETAGLFDPGTLGVVLLLGFALFLALPGMIWAIARARSDARWGVLAVYAWYFLALSALQVRFVGEFAPFVAVFAGLGFVWLATWIDAISGPDFDDRSLNPLRVPDRRTLATLALLFLLVGSLGIIQVPVKNSQVLVDDDAVRSAAFIDNRAEGLNQTYPENYVFSQWGANRMYNYFVSGESRSYAFAQRNFQNFSESRNPDEWYDRLGNRVGYVVMRTAEGANGSTTRWQLSREFGSATPTRDGLAHYRALYRSPDGSRTVFGVVPGAVINGSAAPNSTLNVSTVVTIPGAEFEYERRTTADPSGDFAVRVANPGDYRVSGPEQSVTVTVPSEGVRNGTRVPV